MAGAGILENVQGPKKDWKDAALSGLRSLFSGNDAQKKRSGSRSRFAMYEPDLAAGSHIGLVRGSNEDSFLYYAGNEHTPSAVVVADGIGGHNNGEIASGLVTRMFLAKWRRYAELTRGFSAPEIACFLQGLFQEINCAITEVNSFCDGKKRMGTTLAAAVFFQDQFVTVHAGDSRVYCLRDGHLIQLTNDHSMAAKIFQKDSLSTSELQACPMSHIITRAVGASKKLSFETHIFNFQEGDRFLVCSDGLNLHLPDPEISVIMRSSENAAKAVSALISRTLHCGAGDNVTAVCVFFPQKDSMGKRK